MKDSEVIKLVYSICKEYNYPIPRVELSKKMRSTLGVCYRSKKLIRLNKKFTEIADKQLIEQVIKHELIHLKYDHHNLYFWVEAQRIGAAPNRTIQLPPKLKEELHKKAPYKYVCKVCGNTIYCYRKRRHKISCAKCCPNKFNPKFLMELQEVIV